MLSVSSLCCTLNRCSKIRVVHLLVIGPGLPLSEEGIFMVDFIGVLGASLPLPLLEASDLVSVLLFLFLT